MLTILSNYFLGWLLNHCLFLWIGLNRLFATVLGQVLLLYLSFSSAFGVFGNVGLELISQLMVQWSFLCFLLRGSAAMDRILPAGMNAMSIGSSLLILVNAVGLCVVLSDVMFRWQHYLWSLSPWSLTPVLLHLSMGGLDWSLSLLKCFAQNGLLISLLFDFCSFVLRRCCWLSNHMDFTILKD